MVPFRFRSANFSRRTVLPALRPVMLKVICPPKSLLIVEGLTVRATAALARGTIHNAHRPRIQQMKYDGDFRGKTLLWQAVTLPRRAVMSIGSFVDYKFEASL